MRKGVLLIGNFLSEKRGTRSVCEDLAERLELAGWPVLRASEFESRGLRLADMVTTIIRHRRNYQVGVVDVFSGYALIWVMLASLSLRLCGRGFVAVLRGGGLDQMRRPALTALWLVMRQASAVVSPSKRLAAQFSKLGSRVQWIPNGLEVALYPYRRRQAPEPRLCWLRAIHEIYNPLMAVKTVARLEEWPEARLSLFGELKSIRLAQRIQRTAQRVRLDGRVTMFGPIPKRRVPEVLCAHDIFLNTTNVESFGVSVVEAGACGLCIVTTNAGELPYLWEHESDALLVPPDDDQAMAAAVRRILTEPGLAGHLSENARRKAERFDWSIVLPHWEQLLLEVAEKARP